MKRACMTTNSPSDHRQQRRSQQQQSNRPAAVVVVKKETCEGGGTRLVLEEVSGNVLEDQAPQKLARPVVNVTLAQRNNAALYRGYVPAQSGPSSIANTTHSEEISLEEAEDSCFVDSRSRVSSAGRSGFQQAASLVSTEEDHVFGHAIHDEHAATQRRFGSREGSRLEGENVTSYSASVVPTKSGSESGEPTEEEEYVGTLYSDDWNEEGDGSWPPIWTREMWLDRRSKHYWLSAKGGRLGCRYCLRAKYMGTEIAQDVSIEWISFEVDYSGETREQQLKSLRNKLQRHEVSGPHLRAEQMFDVSNSKKDLLMQNRINQTLNRNLQKAAHVFRDIYSMVKESTYFEQYQTVFCINLKGKSYADFAHRQRFKVPDIIKHIADQMRSNLVRQITDKRVPMAVIVDHIENYLPSAETVFLIYLRVQTDDLVLRDLFWDAVAYPGDDNPKIEPMHAISQSLLDGGFTVDFLSANLICFVTDPLSVHLGADSSLCDQLALSFDKIIIWYVLGYRVEEMVLAASRKLRTSFLVGRLYDALWTLMQLDERNEQELVINMPGIHSQLERIGLLRRPRDIASTFAGVSALVDAYAILFAYVVQARSDPTRTDEEQQRYAFIKNLMVHEQFVRELAVLYDVLQLLNEVRTQVDSSECDIARADTFIVHAMESLVDLLTRPGQFEMASLAGLSDPEEPRLFLSVGPIVSDDRLDVFDRSRFLECIIDFWRQNMISISGLNEDLVENFIRDLHTVNLASWPAAPPVTYADESVRRICALFSIAPDEEVRICEAFRIFASRGCPLTEIPNEIAHLQVYANIFPCSSALCADVIDKVNQCQPVSSADSVQILSAALFLHYSGDDNFSPIPFVRSWCLKHPFVTDAPVVKAFITRRKRRRIEAIQDH